MEPTTAANDGRFFFSGVPPGQYQLFAESRRSPVAGPARTTESPAPSLYAQTDVVVGSRTGLVTLDLVPGSDIHGVVRLEGAQELPPSVLHSVSIGVNSLTAPTNVVVPVIPDENGAFVIHGVPPGGYRIWATPPRSEGVSSSNDSSWSSVVTRFFNCQRQLFQSLSATPAQWPGAGEENSVERIPGEREAVRGADGAVVFIVRVWTRKERKHLRGLSNCQTYISCEMPYDREAGIERWPPGSSLFRANRKP
jgi:hypothetical protein